ncbi:FMN-binding protein [Kribbella sp.]|uniref:FMN-binding protein n=1 Tax=Kribbella sp. TaxID=1871183 RepID=UPI002D51FD43|nr:FMN-binding protein [Kribbella sp.]HZX06232.1 FMN-binding protein [Kribbella sp.]
MRRGIRLLMTVATTAVLAVAFRASLQSNTTTTGQAAVVSSTTPARTAHPARRTPHRTTPTAPTNKPKPTTPAKKPTPTTPAKKAVVVSGGVVDTQYGPVQVEISVSGGKITRSHTLQHPSGDGQTDRINGYAVPQLDQEAMAAQNANIDTVSGATFTSGGYRQSLQSALDAAHQAGAL